MACFASGSIRAQWALDDVIIAVNQTSPRGFQENFNPMSKEVWYNAMNAVPKVSCNSEDKALEFSKTGLSGHGLLPPVSSIYMYLIFVGIIRTQISDSMVLFNRCLKGILNLLYYGPTIN